MNQKRGRRGWMAIKADMEKTYNRVEWDFLLKVLRLFGFHPTWVRWVEQCIQSSPFAIILNGGSCGSFMPSRGIHQGYPLSPALFILCSKVLSRLLLKEELAGRLKGVQICRSAPKINHLLFVDDLLLFSKATVRDSAHMDSIQSGKVIYSLQQEFSWAAGYSDHEHVEFEASSL